MKKYRLYCRYSDIHVIIEDGDNFKLSLADSPYVRAGYTTDETPSLSFIDPAGGPFITVGASLDEYNNKLPKRVIKEIKRLEFDEDDEYIEYELITEKQ